MVATIDDFRRAADATFFVTRDILVDQGKVRLGNLVFSSGSRANDATLKAFREALSHKYGVFGEHTFDTLLGTRAQLHGSLRACDVKMAISCLELFKKRRFINELARQLDTNPGMQELSQAVRKKVRKAIADSPFGDIRLKQCKTAEEMTLLASKRIDEAVKHVESKNAHGKNIAIPLQKDNACAQVTIKVRGDEPVGLQNLTITFKKNATSIEDKVKRGSLGVGMRINRSVDNPVLLEKLKTNGVEPGFIFRSDWSLNDTRAMLADIHSARSKAALDTLKRKCPALAAKCAGLPLREQIMRCGRAHPAGMAAVAEYMLEKGLEDKNSAISKAFHAKFSDNLPDMRKTEDCKRVKEALFVEIRNAVLGVKKGEPAYELSPIFRHFNDRHIMKLDYNEGDRLFSQKTASAGKFMRPERVTARKFGQLFRIFSAKTAEEASRDAVTEALANDITRLAGIPSQELSIVRGQYSDGHPKLMLTAKLAEDYKDMEDGYLKDGQVVPPKGVRVESLGKYKAFFLVTADRDAVGSHGQNKGFTLPAGSTEAKFFAIDPGHSLQGNGQYLEIYDNFSFKDTKGFSLAPRFRNFSVFDDDTRFAKLQGVLALRELQQSGKIDKLFNDYRATFSPDPYEKISSEERQLRIGIQADINRMETEFRENLAKMLNVVGSQLMLYDDLATDGLPVQEKAIETIENLEKLTSPTTWHSPGGLVPLKHLAVMPGTRVPWRAHVEGGNIIYQCSSALSREARAHLQMFAMKSGASLTFDAGERATLILARANAATSLDVFSEKHVAAVTHPEEAKERNRGQRD